MSYLVVSNIPKSYRSADLRKHFKQFTEKGCFGCFHFKHRPEERPDVETTQEDQTQVHAFGAYELSLFVNFPLRYTFRYHDRSSTFSCRPNELMNAFQTFCCVIRIEEAICNEFLETYHHKKWYLDPNKSEKDCKVGVAVIIRTKIDGKVAMI